LKLFQTRIAGMICGLALLAVPVFSESVQEQPPQPSVSAQQSVSVIKEITHRKMEATGRLVVTVRVEGRFGIETFALGGPARLVIDFSPVPLIEAPPLTHINEAGLLNIRAGQFLPNVARLVFDLEEPTPSYNISSLPDGVRITFWREAAVKPAAPRAPAAVPAAGAAPETFVRGGGLKNMLLRVGVGMSLFFKPEFSVTADSSLYGRPASLTESYRQGMAPVLELGAGVRINPKFKAGLGFGHQMLWMNPALEGSLPHPTLPGIFREVVFEAEDLTDNMRVLADEDGEPRAATRLRSGLWTVYAWGLYSIYQSDKVDLSAGPVVGFSFGKLFSLEDFAVNDVAPYGAQNVTISSVTYLENNFAKIDPGLLASLTYLLDDYLSLTANLRIHYVDVIVEELQRRASLFRASFSLGLEFGL